MEHPETPSEGQTSPQARCSVCCDLRLEIINANHLNRSGHKLLACISPAYKNLISSQQKGCMICSLILRAIKMYSPRRTPNSVQVNICAKDESRQEFYPLQVSFGLMNELHKPRRFSLQLYAEQDFPIDLPIGQARAVSQHPNSSKCLNLLSSWLSQCRDNHEACSDPVDVTLPTRVISVGSETTLPRLYVPEEGTRGQYAALSHCWGGDVPLKTLTANIEEHQRGIPEERLPKTFLDAVYIARKLQIPFLWVDSLCIIQDAHEDWAREAGRMGSYYSGAFLTIAADNAANSSEGCLKERPREAWNSVRIEGTQFGLKNDVYVRFEPRRSTDDLGHTFDGVWSRSKTKSAWPKSHLNKRAWTLQEWALSRRIVHFTNGELVWECQQESACECAGQFWYLSSLVPKLAPNGLVEDLSALYWQWMVIVSKLSERAITHETDRLPAISGVAEVISKKTKDEYICGIWKNYPATLVWQPEHGRALRQDSFYAPSWSWASIAAPLRMVDEWGPWDYQERSNLAEILNIDATLDTSNPFGPVKKHAKLTIRGRVFPGRIDEHRSTSMDGGNYFLVGDRSSSGKIKLDFPGMPKSDVILAPGDVPFSEEDQSRIETDLHPGERFYVLVIFQEPDDHLSEVERSLARGLVLKPVDESASIYRRVGTYSEGYWEPGTPEWDHSEERTVTLV